MVKAGQLDQLGDRQLALSVLVLGVSVLADVEILGHGLLADIPIFTKLFKPHAIFTSKEVYKSQNEILLNISKCDIVIAKRVSPQGRRTVKGQEVKE